jgi:hypothetical protein
VVHPKPPPDAPPPDGGIDDWIVPGKPPDDGPDDWIAPGPLSADGHPDDWIVPPPAAWSTGQFPSATPPNAANSARAYPAVPPDPFAAYWSTIPASRVGAMAWDPPNLPLFPPSPTANFPAPTASFWPPTPSASWPPALGLASPPWSSPHSLPNHEIPKGGLLDGLATLGTGWPAGEGGLLGGLRNLGTQADSTWSLPKGGLLDALATLGTPPSAAPTWPLGGLSGLASSSPGSGSLFSSPQPPQSAYPSTTSPIERDPIGSYSNGEIAGDAAKSFGVGLGRGVIQLAGLSGDMREMLARGTQRAVDYIAPDFAPNVGEALSKALASTFPSWSGPTSSQLQSAAESVTGPFYQPKTVVGDYAQTGGEFLPGVMLMPGGGLARSALRYGLLPALSSETAGQLTKGTAAEPWARAIAAILAAAPSAWRDLPLARRVPEIAEGEGGGPRTSGDVLGPPTSSEQVSPGAGPGRPELDAFADNSVAGDLGQTKNGDIGSPGAALADPEVVSRDSGTQPPRSDSNDFNGRGVWDLPATIRGRILEKIFGHNLHPNHPTIDIWDTDTGAATGLKSIDLESPSYQADGKSVNALYNKLSKAVHELAEFTGGDYAGTNIPEHEITSRTLTVIVPGLGTPAQSRVLRLIGDLGKERGVAVKIEVHR